MRFAASIQSLDSLIALLEEELRVTRDLLELLSAFSYEERSNPLGDYEVLSRQCKRIATLNKKIDRRVAILQALRDDLTYWKAGSEDALDDYNSLIRHFAE